MVQIVEAVHIQKAEFIVDAVLFDMDGTLVDSIDAVESAWGGVAVELGKDPQEVIDATHGRRAIDNLRDLKPQLRKLSDNDMDPHVEEFETRILNEADHFEKEVRSRRQSMAEEIRLSRSNSRRNSQAASRRGSVIASRVDSANDSPAGSNPPSRKNSMAGRKGSFGSELAKRFAMTGLGSMTPASQSGNTSPTDSGVSGLNAKATKQDSSAVDEDPFEESDDESDIESEIDIDALEVDTSDLKDKSVKILPGVRRMIDSIPKGRYAVATSGAKTYCHGALSRVGIIPPEVTITADDKRLERGKPFPDPFILAAECLGYDPKKCLVVEDSPSGIKAGVASGATTIAVATSHPVEKIKDSGAHYLVPTLDCVHVEVLQDGRLKIIIDADYQPQKFKDADKQKHLQHAAAAVQA